MILFGEKMTMLIETKQMVRWQQIKTSHTKLFTPYMMMHTNFNFMAFSIHQQDLLK